MTEHVEQELLELDDADAKAVTCFPPAIGIEGRMAGGPYCDARRARDRASKDAAQTAGVIGRAHDHDSAQAALIAPRAEHVAFAFGPARGRRNHFDVRDPKRTEQFDQIGGLVLMANVAAGELLLRRGRRRMENSHQAGDSTVDEIGRLEGSFLAGPWRHDDGVGSLHRLVDDEQAAGGAEDRLPRGDADGRERGERERHASPATRSDGHASMIFGGAANWRAI
jgi:hypothetical protein